MSDKAARRAQMLEERYGLGYEPKGIIWNEQVEHMMNHRSIRTYRADPLPEGALETMVAAAQSASTSSNLHMWSVIAVTDPGIKSELYRTSGHGNPFIEVAPVFLLWVADQSRNNAISKANGGSAIVHDHLDAFVMATIDTALAAQNAALAAESLGLGTVYIGGMRNKSKEVADLLGLPDYAYVAFGMVVGYPATEAQGRLRPRPSQEVVLHRNRYEADRAVKIAAYEEPFKHFREELGMKEKTFVEAVGFSANDLIYMDGRENLRLTVEGQGFKLL
ncbi:NADPH-dependent oxidoreductase [Rhizobiales bacterium RZME27]|uniref:NADPH-dependent oxidoreductase n=1 Tax=Endobacterium cereale TaxID=2663029 RepID=A0A6A8AEX1_9HYPH|nr:nitroreductase family protein [Endobacterium cereale]MEB2847773.1 nitroreductase family protein [Endobacterium cereale]MQY47766.1 NADPH-dependent oxidoreductase [Endobacterium cereale]